MRLVSTALLCLIVLPACGEGPAASGDATGALADSELRGRSRPRQTGGAPGTGGDASTTGGAPGSEGALAAAGGAPGSAGAPAGTGGSAGSEPGQLVFVGDFETGDLSQWAYVERCQDDRIQIYSTANAPAGAPAPREGRFAARFHVLDSDVAPCTSTENPRAELETPESLFKPGDDRWEAWSLFIPTSHPRPTAETWFVIQEDYGAPWDGSPSIGWVLDFDAGPARLRMDRGEPYDHDQPLLTTLPLGSWVDLLVHKKFANTTGGGGFVEAWVDKVPMTFSTCGGCTRLMTQTMHSTQRQVGFYLMAYRAQGTLQSFDTYYDAVRIGTTREAVELPR